MFGDVVQYSVKSPVESTNYNYYEQVFHHSKDLNIVLSVVKHRQTWLACVVLIHDNSVSKINFGPKDICKMFAAINNLAEENFSDVTAFLASCILAGNKKSLK